MIRSGLALLAVVALSAGACSKTIPNTSQDGGISTSSGNSDASVTNRDECATDNGGCAQLCTNTAGSHTCGCNGGYSLNADGKACDDVNECDTDNGGCAQLCTNTVGSYTCACNTGYSLNADGKACDDVNECDTDNGGCAQLCTNTVGSYTCGCNAGYSLNADGKACDDVNECDTNNGGCAQVCTNTVGSYTCSNATEAVVVVEATLEDGVDSGISISSGQTLTITASGSWGYDSGVTYGPDGEGPSQPNWGTSILQAKIGSGNWFDVGASYSETVSESGEIFLRMDDAPGQYYNNWGSVTANVSVSGG